LHFAFFISHFSFNVPEGVSLNEKWQMQIAKCKMQAGQRDRRKTTRTRITTQRQPPCPPLCKGNNILRSPTGLSRYAVKR
jgi:hypothetical protein